MIKLGSTKVGRLFAESVSAVLMIPPGDAVPTSKLIVATGMLVLLGLLASLVALTSRSRVPDKQLPGPWDYEKDIIYEPLREGEKFKVFGKEELLRKRKAMLPAGRAATPFNDIPGTQISPDHAQ